MKKSLTLVAITAICSSTFAQSTYQEIYGIFQANCAVGCHSGGSPSGNLDLYGNGDSSVVYNNIIETTPINPVAVAKGQKLIDPGYPERSFLLRKCATNAWEGSAAMQLDVAEGNSMPDNPSTLDKEELELIRQWIIFGAPIETQVVDPQLLTDYYTGLGMDRIDAPPTPEEEGEEGFQIHMGPFFLGPLEEVEHRWKYELQDTDSMEVIRTNAFFNDESHHFILWKFGEGVASSSPDGYRPATEAELFTLNMEQVTAWQDEQDNILPQTTAYKWETNTVLDPNYHILNYSSDSILAAECYINIYTQEVGTADLEMKSTLIGINILDFLLGTGEIGDDLIIPNDGQEHGFTDIFGVPITIPNWHVWSLFGHTHQLGSDYDIWIHEGNGVKGDQIYEGFYNTDYTFNQGYFDWEHPPVRKFDPLLEVDMSMGFVHRAKYINNTSDTVRWGLTTEDEMMLFAIQYTEGAIEEEDTSGVGITELQNFYWHAAPNPFKDQIFITYKLDEPGKVQSELFDIYGKKITDLTNTTKPAGRHKLFADVSNQDLAAGTYLLRFTVNGQTATKRLMYTGK